MRNATSQCRVSRYLKGHFLNLVHKYKILEFKGIYIQNEASPIPVTSSRPIRVSRFHTKFLGRQTYSGINIHPVVDEILITNSVFTYLLTYLLIYLLNPFLFYLAVSRFCRESPPCSSVCREINSVTQSNMNI
jgi:hypothetical protein